MSVVVTVAVVTVVVDWAADAVAEVTGFNSRVFILPEVPLFSKVAFIVFGLDAFIVVLAVWQELDFNLFSNLTIVFSLSDATWIFGDLICLLKEHNSKI